MVEPYFGTANANECHENLKSSEIEHQDQTFRAVIQLLSSGPERIIHDCLIVNNSHWLKVEFVTCKNVFYDIRTYSPVSGTRPDVSSEFKCES